MLLYLERCVNSGSGRTRTGVRKHFRRKIYTLSRFHVRQRTSRERTSLSFASRDPTVFPGILFLGSREPDSSGCCLEPSADVVVVGVCCLVGVCGLLTNPGVHPRLRYPRRNLYGPRTYVPGWRSIVNVVSLAGFEPALRASGRGRTCVLAFRRRAPFH